MANDNVTLTKLVVHEGVVSSTFTTMHFSYTRIPNGAIKVISMQDTSSILLSIFYWIHSYTCTSFKLKNTTCNVRGVCDPRKFFDTKVLKSIFLHEHFSIYGNQWLWIRSNWNEYTVT